MSAITNPCYGSGARWGLGPDAMSNCIDLAVNLQGRDTRKKHDPSEKLPNIGGLAPRPAGGSAARPAPPRRSGSSPPPSNPALRSSDSSAPAPRRAPPTGRRFSEISGIFRLCLSRDSTAATDTTTRLDWTDAISATRRAGWIWLCMFDLADEPLARARQSRIEPEEDVDVSPPLTRLWAGRRSLQDAPATHTSPECPAYHGAAHTPRSPPSPRAHDCPLVGISRPQLALRTERTHSDIRAWCEDGAQVSA